MTVKVELMCNSVQLYITALILGLLLYPISNISYADEVDLDAVFMKHSVPMYWLDPSSGEIIEANPAAVSFYGYEAALFEGMKIDEINTLSPKQVAEEMALAKQEGRNYFIFRHRLADGDIRTVEIHSHPFKRHGKLLLLSVVHDITPGRNLDHGLWHYKQRLEELVEEQTADVNQRNRVIILLLLAGLALSVFTIVVLTYLMRQRQKAEAETRRFRSIAESAMYGNLITDLRGHVLYCNPFFANIHGYTVQELKGKHLSVFHCSEQMPAVETLLSQLKQQDYFPPTEVWHYNRNGYEFPMLMSGIVMPNDQGQPAYLATAAIDLTDHFNERQQAERLLISAKEEAENASRVKSEFLANMSHEIRTPLNAIIGLSELQIAESLPERSHHRAREIYQSGELLLGIVNDLLDFSEIESKTLVIKADPFRLSDVISQLDTLFGPLSRQKGVELLFTIQHNLPQWYTGDRVRLTQVMTNLLGNAVKFTEQGKIELQIEGECLSDERTRLVFRVKDSGIGMTQEQQKKLFQAFSQADTSITRRHGGAGLGLSISQRLVLLMGGESIHVESEAGVGSCFCFELCLPIAQVQTSSGDQSETDHLCDETAPVGDFIEPGLWRPVSLFKNQRVLVVEDNPVNQQVVQSQLEQMGLGVELASDGAEGVERVRQGGVDLVLMDIQMPVMDGYEATKAIRSFNQDIPVVALTAAALIEDRDKALNAGMNDHLGKPFSGQQLFKMLEQWLELAPMVQQSEESATAPEPQPAAGQPVSPAAKNRLLIVDDVATNIRILANLLKDEYTIQVANNGQKALEIAQGNHPPDLILLDILMPDMDGYAVCRELKQKPETSKIPVIFVSALGEVEDESRGLALGAVDYITKPFHAQVVKARVRNHMSLKLKTDLLENLSNFDGLTQLANRRRFDEVLQSEARRLSRSGKPLALIMLDIDFFKPFNDNYGHGKGDECLIKVATALQQVTQRPGDLVARYGGEEFVVVLPETDIAGAAKVAEAMRRAVESLNYPHEYSSIADHVTVSVGYAAAELKQGPAEALLEQADHALYRAKSAGRNRVVGTS